MPLNKNARNPPMIINNPKVIFSNWKKAQKACRPIRETVFILEQKIDSSLEWDNVDNLSTHVLLRNNNLDIGCARFFYKENYIKLERMAILKKYRKQGFGSLLIESIVKHIRGGETLMIIISAQVAAIPFYKKQGFVLVGDSYIEAGINHHQMVLNILE
jgi:predicted GNAT family N-acyltransferase|tara:strand:- start:23538 stop:24014 length:477 start_codon:yes stop_codon:yes gene_type:complete